jgi:hypothetical protein
VKSMCLMITKELILEPELGVSHGVAAFPNDLHKIRGDHVGELDENDDTHPGLPWVVREDIVRLIMVGEGISH